MKFVLLYELCILIQFCGGFFTYFSFWKNLSTKNIVKTDKGLVRPEVLTTVISHQKYLSFQGIPYAKPPLGKLRFKPPMEPEPWKGVLYANRRDIKCVQRDQATYEWSGVEDCLVLNVYTPELNLANPLARKRAVIVWIHGGSFRTGHGGYQIYGPDHFMEEDVVLVSFNYRLGPFGFMTLNHPDAIGNNGLKDQNFVLKWVQRNIDKFAGDPNLVVIVGESAGASAVDFHVLSDLSKGLFHRSISMSGSPFCPWSFTTPYKAEKKAFHLGKLLNNNIQVKDKDELLNILYSKSALEIMEKTEELGIVPPFLPSLEDPNVAPNEDKFMTQCYLSKYLSGNYTKLPHLMGFTSNEALIFSKVFDDFLEAQELTIDEIKNINNLYPSLSTALKVLLNISLLLFNFSTWAVYEILRVASDIIFYVGIDTKQRIMMQTNHDNVYYYRFSYDGGNETFHQYFLKLQVLQGVSHADDLFYIFYPRFLSIYIGPGSMFERVIKRVVKLWCNFVKYGNPTPPGLNDPSLDLTWPKTDAYGTYLDIGNRLIVKHERPVDSRVIFYEEENLDRILHSKGCIDKSILEALLRINPFRPTLFLFNLFHQLIVNC